MTKRTASASALLLGLFITQPAAAGAGATLEEATEGDKKLAQDAYYKAMTAFDKGDFKEALVGFQDSHGIVASPNIRFMIARTLARLGRFDDAVKELDTVIFEAAREMEKDEKYAETHAAAIQKRDELLGKLASVTVKVLNPPKGTSVYADTRKLTEAELKQPFALMPGETLFRAQPPSGPAWETTVELQPGKAATVTLQAPPEKKEEKPDLLTPGKHPDTWLELEAHLAVTSFNPPGPAEPGAGVGVGATVVFWDNGPFASLNNTLGVGARAARIFADPETYTLIPMYLQYNLWLSKNAAALLEGEATYVSAETETRWIPGFRVGGRYRFESGLALVARFGWPGLTAGAAYSF